MALTPVRPPGGGDPAVALRRARRLYPTGVAVVTALDGHGPGMGVTVSSLTFLSTEPPLLSFAVTNGTAAHRLFTAVPRFLVNLLGPGQSDVACRFAARGQDRPVDPSDSFDGLPALPGALGRLACDHHGLVEGGDQTIVLGLVRQAEVSSGDPLVYWNRGYCVPVRTPGPRPPGDGEPPVRGPDGGGPNGGGPDGRAGDTRTLDRLTPRQRQIAALVANGLTNRQIARLLNITDKTVEMHLSNIFARLGISSRVWLATLTAVDPAGPRPSLPGNPQWSRLRDPI